jgi:flavin-dependent dehydrogenase
MTEARVVKTETRTVCKKGALPAQLVKTDICVVGAGIAGVSAALEAARLGHKVVFADALPALGGQAVNSIIGIFCGLFSNGPKPFPFTHGIADDILKDLGAAGAIFYRRGAWTTAMYDAVALSRWIEEAVRIAGINVILGAVLRGANRDGRRIHSIDLATVYGDVQVSANSFVDATGDATLAWHAGLPCRVPAEGTVYGSYLVEIEGIDLQTMPTREEIAAALRDKTAGYGLVRRDGFAFPFPPKGTVLVNMTHVETPLEPMTASANVLTGKAQADLVVKFLKKEFPHAFGNARIRKYGLLGIRQARWIVGSHQLTVDEVRTGKHFCDAIARTAWPIELHDSREGYYWEQFSDDHVHYVPFGSMTPPDVDNLVAAGRCIDGDMAALSSVRVMGPCMAMGAAAAHGLDLAGTSSVHGIDIAALQERVKDNLIRTDSEL